MQMRYLYVRVVRARDLPPSGVTAGCDPYVEIKLGNYKGQTRHFERKTNPEWNQVGPPKLFNYILYILVLYIIKYEIDTRSSWNVV